MLELNAEHVGASPARRQQIEQEIINLVPKEEFPPSLGLSELSRLHSDLKNKINKIAHCATKSDFDLLRNELVSLDEQLCNHAKLLGAELERTDYGKIFNKLLEDKFGK